MNISPHADLFEKALSNIPNKFYEFDYISKKQLVVTTLNNYNSYNEMPKIPENKKGIYLGEDLVDINHSYILNSFGYRSPEFENVSILAGGCSQTFGIGVPQKMTWSYQLSKNLDATCANISKPGASVQWIVQKMFAYFKEYGNPKQIVCVFPDFYRMVFATNTNLLKISEDFKNNISDIILLETIDEKPKYSKSPHKVQDVIPSELAFYISCHYINILEHYCKSHNIKFAWTTWKYNLGELIKSLSREYGIFENYLDVDDNRWINHKDRDILCKYKEDADNYNANADFIDCHIEVKEEYSHCFDKGADYEKNPEFRHMGIHRHIHFAEAFTNFIKNEVDK